jgi:putative transposase
VSNEESCIRGCLKRYSIGNGGKLVIARYTCYPTDLSDAAWTLLAPLLPPARPGGRSPTTELRAILNAISYLLRTGCQWRLLPREFPAWGTVYHYFRSWKNTGVWTCIQRTIYEQVRKEVGRSACPSLVIMDGQSVKQQSAEGVRGFDAHKCIKGRKRHILVDTLGLPITFVSSRPTYRIAARPPCS